MGVFLASLVPLGVSSASMISEFLVSVSLPCAPCAGATNRRRNYARFESIVLFLFALVSILKATEQPNVQLKEW